MLISLSPLLLALVLIAALMHAGWNTLVKVGHDRLVAVALIHIPIIAVAGMTLAFVDPPDVASWPYIIGSSAVTTLYFYALINAYRVSDLSLAYPIARGIAPLLVLGLSAISAAEIPSAFEFLGVTIISFGLLALGTHQPFSSTRHMPLLWAGGVGLCIACYTVIDGLGARISGSPIGYTAIKMIITGASITVGATWVRGITLFDVMRQEWVKGLIGGAMMFAAYAIVIYALTLAPMAQVAALRETSIIFAALIGSFFLREGFGSRRIVSSILVVSGVAVLAVSG